jgi:hypothetical protein
MAGALYAARWHHTSHPALTSKWVGGFIYRQRVAHQHSHPHKRRGEAAAPPLSVAPQRDCSCGGRAAAVGRQYACTHATRMSETITAAVAGAAVAYCCPCSSRKEGGTAPALQRWHAAASNPLEDGFVAGHLLPVYTHRQPVTACTRPMSCVLLCSMQAKDCSSLGALFSTSFLPACLPDRPLASTATLAAAALLQASTTGAAE